MKIKFFVSDKTRKVKCLKQRRITIIKLLLYLFFKFKKYQKMFLFVFLKLIIYFFVHKHTKSGPTIRFKLKSALFFHFS